MGRESRFMLALLGLLAGVFVAALSLKLFVPRPPRGTGPDIHMTSSTASTAIIKLMARALYRIPNMSMGRAAFYMNRTVHSGLSLAAMDKSQYVLKIEQALTQFGQPNSYLSFLGVPLRRVDALVNTESVVS